MIKINNTLPVWLFVCAFALVSADRPKLVKTKISEGITVSIPQGWRPMDGLDFRERYPSVRAPLAAYTNEERLVDFSVNVSATQWPDTDIDIAQEFFRASIMNSFDRVEMIDQGIHEINKKKFIFFEFESRVNGIKQKEGFRDPVIKYTYIQYLIEPGKALVFSFNCPKRERENWQETARMMMKAIKIK
jgi:hypothetical protein